MYQRQAFMQAIIEAPDDDAPRLVFAGWAGTHATRPIQTVGEI